MQNISKKPSYFISVLSTLEQFIQTGSWKDSAERTDFQTAPLIAALKSEKQSKNSLAEFPKVSNVNIINVRSILARSE